MGIAEKIEGRKRPYCGSVEQQIKLGTAKAGSARYQCKVCGKIYTRRERQRVFGRSERISDKGQMDDLFRYING